VRMSLDWVVGGLCVCGIVFFMWDAYKNDRR
jgi:hypothetical protein